MSREQANRGMHGTIPMQKPKHFSKSLAKLFHFMKPYKWFIITALALAILGTFFNVVGPKFIEEMTASFKPEYQAKGGFKIFESLFAKNNFFLNIAIFLVILYGIGFLFSYAQAFIMATVTQKNSRDMRRAISKKINVIPLNYYDTNTIGDTLSRVTNDVDTISQALNQSVIALITSVLMIGGTLIMMFITEWRMAFTAVGASMIGFILMGIIMKHSQKFFRSQQRYLGQLNGHIEETYSGHNVVKAYNAERQVQDKYDTINKNLHASAWKSQFISGLMMPLMIFVGNLGYVAVCIVGAMLMINHQLANGLPTILAFMIYVRLFTSPLGQLGQAFTSLQTAAAASERVFEFLAEKELDAEKDKTKYLNPKDIKGEVIFDHVQFGYLPNKLILKDCSFIAKPSQKIAIVGPTGAGKTTMVNLLMRFYETNSGKITIDGISTADLKRENVHELFCMVLQDTWLFKGSIKENIVYSKQNVSDEAVIAACKAVGMHHYIQSLPYGYDTILDDKSTLSSGQKQLLTIARAIIEDSPMLILDEATSSVDTRTEVLIQKAMDNLTVGRTSFVIAHRLSTIKNADLILVMQDGDIVESGNHEELILRNGIYAGLYNSQFEQE